MCDVREASVDAGKTDPLPANNGRRSSQADTHVWHLPRLWGGLFSRLYEQVGLSSGGVTPRGKEILVRLSAWMPYESARELLEDLLGVQVSKTTAWRVTVASGEAALAVEEAEVERLKPEGVLHRLKHQGPARVLTHLAWLAARYPGSPMQEKSAYLQKREAQMHYPTFQAARWPIGSGSVESANKLVVEARLKGAGMRLSSPERQPDARPTQCGLQSRVEANLGHGKGSSARGTHPAATSKESAPAGAGMLVPRDLGNTSGTAVSSSHSCSHRSEAGNASNSSS